MATISIHPTKSGKEARAISHAHGRWPRRRQPHVRHARGSRSCREPGRLFLHSASTTLLFGPVLKSLAATRSRDAFLHGAFISSFADAVVLSTGPCWPQTRAPTAASSTSSSSAAPA
jgi:hypothetical protein